MRKRDLVALCCTKDRKCSARDTKGVWAAAGENTPDRKREDEARKEKRPLVF